MGDPGGGQLSIPQKALPPIIDKDWEIINTNFLKHCKTNKCNIFLAHQLEDLLF